MSKNLYWRPFWRKGTELDDQLKYILRDNNRSNYNFSACEIPYLEGLRDAGIKGAKELIKAIEKHETVTVYEE